MYSTRSLCCRHEILPRIDDGKHRISASTKRPASPKPSSLQTMSVINAFKVIDKRPLIILRMTPFFNALRCSSISGSYQRI